MCNESDSPKQKQVKCLAIFALILHVVIFLVSGPHTTLTGF
jgi:hypothetical protein